MWYKSRAARADLPSPLTEAIPSSVLLSHVSFEATSNSQRKAAHFCCLWRVSISVQAKQEGSSPQSHNTEELQA